jgi:ABC-type Fe2+-enterobactin transport system substrate-binding protein
MQENKSEVARLREQIAQEYLAATRGLSGLAAGVSRHDFIQVRMENMGRCHEQLSILLGSAQEATRLVAETLEQADVVE